MSLLGEKFQNPHVTATGEARASVALTHPEVLWFNTGTLCNITCDNCYIESSPSNDRLVYLATGEVETYLAELRERAWPVQEIGFTGGEPFMNPDCAAMLRVALAGGFRVLVLTNAMRPMLRPAVQQALLALQREFGAALTLRVSLDHWSADKHNRERGPGAFAESLVGMAWLQQAGICTTVAGRMAWGETEAQARAGYAELYRDQGFDIDAMDPACTVLFPEMGQALDVPEISTACWQLLGKSPEHMMCASSRMVVKRKGASRPAVVSCTLLPYEAEFELGPHLADAEGAVQLNHPHCSTFCVLGGGSCSG